MDNSVWAQEEKGLVSDHHTGMGCLEGLHTWSWSEPDWSHPGQPAVAPSGVVGLDLQSPSLQLLCGMKPAIEK